MRQGESPDQLPPEALARIEDQKRDHRVGLLIIVVALIVGAFQVIKFGDLTVTVGIACGVGLIVGGNLIDPDRFDPLTRAALDKLPGGKSREGGES